LHILNSFGPFGRTPREDGAVRSMRTVSARRGLSAAVSRVSPPSSYSSLRQASYATRWSPVWRARTGSPSASADPPHARREASALAASPSAEAARSASASALSTVGATYAGFTVERVVDSIPARGLGPIVVLRHAKSGARWLHAGCPGDENNVFCVVLRTVPQDSAGVAHVLEHTVLSGSKKFPVRDPFFNMLRRSVSTYMNAWTGSDFTAYPFSSCNAQDFANLTKVYCDAVFFPNLDKWDFLQEGHRLEAGEDGSVTRTGVVFNEMKGAMSDSSSLFAQRVAEELFSGTTYEHNSGGTPAVIPTLTHEALKDFHRKHYHPSNATFVTYGNLPLETHLDAVNELVLSEFDVERDGDSSLETVIPAKVPEGTARRIEEPAGFPSNPLAPDPEKQTKVAVTWRVNDGGADTLTEGIAKGEDSAFETFSLSLLSTLLCAGPNSPMYKALIESRLGSGYSPGAGYDPYSREATFSYGLSDVYAKDAPEVERLVLETLENVARDGFPEERINAVLQQLEVGIRSQSANFGLAIVQAVFMPIIHQSDPIEHLQEQKHVDRFRRELAANPEFFKDLVRKYFLDNNERLTLVMSPDSTYAQRLQEAEDSELASLSSSMTPSDIETLREQSAELKQRQDAEQNVECLPMLDIERDIPRRVERVVPVTSEKLNSPTTPASRTFWVDQPTNDLVYFRGLAAAPGNMELHAAGKNLGGPTEFVRSMSLVSLIPLWRSLVGSVPTSKKTHQELSQHLELYTGGVSVGMSVIADPDAIERAHLHTAVSGTAQHQYASPLGELLSEILQSSVYTNEAAKDVIRIQVASSAAALADSIVSSGHSFAVSRASRWISPRHWLGEYMNGVTGLKFMQQLAQEMSDPTVGTAVVDSVAERLQLLHSLLCSGGLQRSLITTGADHFEPGTGVVEAVATAVGGWHSHDAPIPGGLGDVSQGAIEFGSVPPTTPVRECVVIPGEVSFAAKALPSVPFHHPDRVALGLASKMIAGGFLHQEVREKGGAYGSGCAVGGGALTMHSYRDPAPKSTVATFDKVPSWIQTAKSRFLADAKLSHFGDLDAPQAPPSRGAQWWSGGSTPQVADAKREKAFELSLQDVIESTTRHISEDKLENDAHICIVSAENMRGEYEPSTWDIVE
jgi:presequence protease